jgi:hypothetical protein
MSAYVMTPSLAFAQSAPELPLDFTWTAPDGCPTRAEVVRELDKAVDAEGKELPPLTVHAVVAQDGATWRLELVTEMEGRRGTRQLEADSCQGLARAATLVLALTLGEGLARRQAEVEAKAATPATPPPPPPPVAEPPRRPAPPPPPSESEPLRVWLWAAVAAGSDPLGSFGPGLVVGVALQPHLLRVGARLGATLPRSTAFEGSGGELRSSNLSAELEACLAPALEPFAFSACASGGLTLFDVEGQGTARDAHAAVPLYGLGPSVGAQWLLGENAFLGLGFVSRFFLSRPELVIEGLSQRKRIETASVSAELGAGVRW